MRERGGESIRLRGYVEGWPCFRACGERGLGNETEEEVCVLLVREECLEGEDAVVSGDAQVASREGEPGAEQGEVGRVVPQSATGAIL